ncbi:hypothetical protein DL89DRAFT_310775 [Linderina pennispora]|uniref:A-kinase anchor protein 7-like phosphoesterase domain-containing protein n=1 Tax=Linderina pennispora TaxID=61395 RepID=A0A1Y1VW86_9FUNG|nr:uncharacterized protein DL89DRAFT_310775 [Linderina pennispora]ORX65559.1 hypothetical protein DL89DRAFT_310775 [Linderina pennispora]
MRTILPSTLKQPKNLGSLSKTERQQRPNYFLAVRLSNPSLQTQLQHFYKSVSETFPRHSRYLINPTLSHVTLGTMFLEKHDIPGAVDLLESFADLVNEYIQEPPKLTLKGIGNFGGNRVVFANVDASHGFQSLVRDIRVIFWSHGYSNTPLLAPRRVPYFGNDIVPHGSAFQVTSGHVMDWKPHATLMKERSLAMPVSVKKAREQIKSSLAKLENSETPRKKPATKIPGFVFENFMNHSFGSQIVSRIELLSMTVKDKDGYYARLGGLDIDK